MSPRVGPLLAVCGLVGGAGATTLAYLLAREAARHWEQPVLVADAGGPSGGLAHCAGVEASRSLPGLAEHLAAGLPTTGGLYAISRDGVRVLARGPEFTRSAEPEKLAALLRDAREAHGLTVIDCGTLATEVEQHAAGEATHVAWLLPVGASAIGRGRRVLAAAPAWRGKELLVARGQPGRKTTSLRELRGIAAERAAPLVLLPDVPALAKDDLARAAEEGQIALQSILGALRR